MSGAIAGPGFFLQKADASGSYTTVTEVKDIKGPMFQTDIHDVTNQSSPNGYEEVVPTIKRPGQITFDVQFQPNDATHDQVTGLLADLDARVLRSWYILIPGNARKWAFTAYVVKFDQTMPVIGVLLAAISLQITGKPVLA